MDDNAEIPTRTTSNAAKPPRAATTDDVEDRDHARLEKRKSNAPNAVKHSVSDENMRDNDNKQRRYSSPPARVENKEGDDEDLCKICYENKIECVILECGHRILCGKCARLPLKECPICRKKIVRIVKTFDG